MLSLFFYAFIGARDISRRALSPQHFAAPRFAGARPRDDDMLLRHYTTPTTLRRFRNAR